MKRQLVFFVLAISWCSYGQQTEFKVYDNGLIYSEASMNKLGTIVDSLNLKFRTCDLTHPYYSFAQGLATKVNVRNKEALKLIESGVSFEAYKQRYPGSIEEEIWITKSRYRDYENKRYIKYSGLPHGWNSESSISVKDTHANDKTTGWIVNRDKSMVFYFHKLEQTTLPYEYARLVQYVDCMIDTTATIFMPRAQGEVYQQVAAGSKADEFVKWARQYPNEPAFPDFEKLKDNEFEAAYEKYSQQHDRWDSLRLLHLDQQLSKYARWSNLLTEAAEESIDTGNSSTEFEFYVARYLSKETALQLKRSRKVVGGCSQDQSPRYHAIEICQLAAETTKWDIFLRSHLDIMNDRFERVSDGSYAWAGRKTYLKELEALDIPAIDLLIGTCLRVENVNENHYWGAIGRVGRALADAEDKAALEQRLLAMVQDEKLDPYNRLLFAYLFSNYAHNLDEESHVAACLKELDKAVNTLPDFVKVVWKKS
ncbi:MAG: hypothetical protein ABL895_15035 [Cyclobacteriaceae bacterium]